MNSLPQIMNEIETVKTLEELWRLTEDVTMKYFPDNGLKPIFGNGKTFKPKFMFIFINPTHANISSHPDWNGPRFPFIGTKQVWKVFYNARMFDKKLLDKINNSRAWSLKLTYEVLGFLKSKSFYLTNIVKYTERDSSLPDSRKINFFLPIIKKEIELVKPRYIVTFGKIPFECLTKRKIRLSDYYERIMKNKQLLLFEEKIRSHKVYIIPSYFPVGRGNPKRAIEILRFLNEL